MLSIEYNMWGKNEYIRLNTCEQGVSMVFLDSCLSFAVDICLLQRNHTLGGHFLWSAQVSNLSGRSCQRHARCRPRISTAWLHGRLEATDKIGLPFSYANEIYERAEQGLELHLPLTFEVTSRLGRKTHCRVPQEVENR